MAKSKMNIPGLMVTIAQVLVLLALGFGLIDKRTFESLIIIGFVILAGMLFRDLCRLNSDFRIRAKA